MNLIEDLPNKKLIESAKFSRQFINEDIQDFHQACVWVKELSYGYNSDVRDRLIIFKEKTGTCSTKHGLIAALAVEINLPVFKFIAFYKLNNSIITDIGKVLDKYNLNYIPQTHCLIGSNSVFVDLTEGNCHGKNKDLEEFDLIVRVKPFPSESEEEELYKFALDYYLKNDTNLSRFYKDDLVNILKECNLMHRNLCSLNQKQ